MGASSSSSTPEYPPDTLVVHGNMERSPITPHLSPFVLKLETYLRIANIKYEYSGKGGYGPKGKIPWISYNGEKMGDSYFIMQHLNQKHEVNLNMNLSAKEEAIATAFRVMIEEFMAMLAAMEMFLWNSTENIKSLVGGIPTPVVWIFRSKVKSNANNQGVGRHTQEEVRHLFEKQVKAIADLLGSNTYIMGSEPCELDCTVFAFLSFMLCGDESVYPSKLIREKYSNLHDYREHVKKTFWPDWEELLAKAKENKDGKTSEKN